MNYFELIKSFYEFIDQNPLPTGQISLWHALAYLNNRSGWTMTFSAPNHKLEALTGLSRQGVAKARNALKQRGLIDFEVLGYKAVTYSLKPTLNKNRGLDSSTKVANKLQKSSESVAHQLHIGSESVAHQLHIGVKNHADQSVDDTMIDGNPLSTSIINSNININNNINNKEKYKKEREKSTSDFLDDFDLSVDVKNLILDFVESRKKLKSPMTNRAIEMLIKKLNGLAQTESEKIKLLETAIERGWKSVFPLNDNQGRTQNTEQKNSSGRPVQQVGEKYTIDDNCISF